VAGTWRATGPTFNGTAKCAAGARAARYTCRGNSHVSLTAGSQDSCSSIAVHRHRMTWLRLERDRPRTPATSTSDCNRPAVAIQCREVAREPRDSHLIWPSEGTCAICATASTPSHSRFSTCRIAPIGAATGPVTTTRHPGALARLSRVVRLPREALASSTHATAAERASAHEGRGRKLQSSQRVSIRLGMKPSMPSKRFAIRDD
jgi:hypothetical protein